MSETSEQDIEAWINASHYDLVTAKAMLQSQRYLYVLFMCQQALEKLLKAYVMVNTGSFPPRIHNLMRLQELARIDMLPADKELLERVSLYYLQVRYPPEIQSLAKGINKIMATRLLQQMEGLWKQLRRGLARMNS